jgi:hypothetical protein
MPRDIIRSYIMAKANSKTSKALSPVAVAVSACYNTILPVLTDQASHNAANKAASESRSKVYVAAITTLCDSIADKDARKAAIFELFGNGLKKKGEVILGSLRAGLESAGVKDVQVYNTLHLCRNVALSFDKDDVRKAASESGLRKAYDATKPPKDDAKDDDKGAAVKVTLEGILGDVIRIEGWAGVIRVMRIMESAASVLKDASKAQVVHDAAVKLAI